MLRVQIVRIDVCYCTNCQRGEHLAQQRGALSIAEVLHEHFERLQVPDRRCPHTTCFTVHNQGPLFKNSRPASMGVAWDKLIIVKGFRFFPQRLQYLEIHRYQMRTTSSAPCEGRICSMGKSEESRMMVCTHVMTCAHHRRSSSFPDESRYRDWFLS
jgi:hypothetical protein